MSHHIDQQNDGRTKAAATVTRQPGEKPGCTAALASAGERVTRMALKVVGLQRLEC